MHSVKNKKEEEKIQQSSSKLFFKKKEIKLFYSPDKFTKIY